MATLISLISFTDQGVRNIKDSPDRFLAFQALAEKAGVKVKAVYYTIGQYDMVIVVEGSEPAAVATMLKVASLGNVRSQTLHGFSVDEMRGMLAGIS